MLITKAKRSLTDIRKLAAEKGRSYLDESRSLVCGYVSAYRAFHLIMYQDSGCFFLAAFSAGEQGVYRMGKGRARPDERILVRMLHKKNKERLEDVRAWFQNLRGWVGSTP